MSLTVETVMINSVEYVPASQLPQIISTAVQASEAKIGQNLSQTAYRQQYGIK
jgi:predicted MFS family arabinose efflux permease